jgi:AcrR family transcriptional regulator
MKEPRETRERLLNTAERLFADRGFKAVTVREICRAARANVASVNYHFGGKLGLYREVIQSAIDTMQEVTEAARAAGEGQHAEEKLRRYIVIFLRRLLAVRNETTYRLLQSEMHDPTPALDTVVEQGLRPRIAYLSAVLAEMMECDQRDPRVLRCLASVQTQFTAYIPNPVAERLGFRFEGTPAQIEEAARHIADFAVAGVHAVSGQTARRKY